MSPLDVILLFFFMHSLLVYDLLCHDLIFKHNFCTSMLTCLVVITITNSADRAFSQISLQCLCTIHLEDPRKHEQRLSLHHSHLSHSARTSLLSKVSSELDSSALETVTVSL